jgi:predicted phage baseplate assembly protein
MTLPEVILDDRDFRSLVKESRRRIAQRCPEWTEHNVSDPGITLIELFAWMTELLLYRVNRIPEKLELALLNLMDVDLHAPVAARTGLRFEFAADRKAPVTVGVGVEVATPRQDDAEPVVFTTTQARTVGLVQLEGAGVRRGGTLTAISVSDEGLARPPATARTIFADQPKPDDELLLGSRSALGNLLLDLTVQCGPAHGLGIDPDAPPWVWEAWGRDRTWHPVTVISDTTGGFNTRGGVIRLEVLQETAIRTIGAQSLHWLRCTPGSAPSGDTPGYVRPPSLEQISLAAVGLNLPAEHANQAGEEMIGVSDGTPGQSFRLTNAPALELRESDQIHVHYALDESMRDDGSRESMDDDGLGLWKRWTCVKSIADSTAKQAHVTFDAADGEVRFGPGVRVPGGWCQHGAIPPAGSRIKITGYRYGGGAQGNLGPGQLTVLREAIPGVARVSNLLPALGGLDGESVEAARQRAPRELRTRERAVTASDFELLVRREVPRVARAKCLRPASPAEAVRVHILPDVGQSPGERSPEDSLASAELLTEVRAQLETVSPLGTHIDVEAHRPAPGESVASDELLEKVKDTLESRSLLGTCVLVVPAKLRVVTCAVEIVGDGRHSPVALKRQVAAELYRYLDPYVGGDLDQEEPGWPWGRDLHRGELESLVRRVAGVRGVRLLKVYASSDTDPRYAAGSDVDHVELERYELIVSGRHQVRVV